jgi:hypothetical protein
LAGGQQFEDELDSDAGTPDNRLSGKNFGVNNDALRPRMSPSYL